MVLISQACAFQVLIFATAILLVPVAEGAGHCPPLEPLSFGRLLFNGNTVLPESTPDQLIEYQCASGYRLVSATENTDLTIAQTRCEAASGNWSLLGVACLATMCDPPPAVNNAEVVNATGVYPVGTTVTYRCSSQHKVETLDTVVLSEQEGVVDSVCNAQGQWHVVPACVAVSSPALSSYTVLVIVLAVVGGICLVTICLAICCSLWAFKLKRDITKGDMAEDEVAYAHSRGAFILNNPLVSPKDDESLANPLYLTPDEMDEFESKNKRAMNKK